MVSFFLPFFPLERSHIRQLFNMRVGRGQGGLWSRMGRGAGRAVEQDGPPAAAPLLGQGGVDSEATAGGAALG